MAQLIFPAVIMIFSLVIGAAVAFSRATDARKWATIALAGAFGYGMSSYAALLCGTAPGFTVLHILGLVALSIMGVSFMFSVAAATGVMLGNPLKIVASVVMLLFAAFHFTTRLHGLSIKDVKLAGPDSSDLYDVTYSIGLPYYIANGVMIAITAIIAVCAFVGLSKKIIKPTSGERVLVVLSVLLTAGTALGGVFTSICVVAGLLLLLLIIKGIDKTDVIDFGKSCTVDSTNDGAIIIDKKKNFLFANKTAKSVFFELSETDRDKMTKFVSTISDKDTLTRGERIFSLKKGAYTDYTGNCDCTIIMIHDITEQELRTSRLNEEAAVDSITGLNSRSSVIEMLENACAELDGTLLNISFDGFKAINNLYGHEDANKLLASFGTILRNNTNTDDIRGRLGGEQFTVFLKGCTNESVIANLTMRIEEQILDALHKQFGESVDVSVGVSVGGVFVPDYGKDYETLSGLAESARLKIKNSGGHGYDIHKASGKATNSTVEDINEFIANTDATSDSDDSAPAESGEVITDHLPTGDDELSEFKL